MDLKENWRAWQRSLVLSLAGNGWEGVWNGREISCGFFVFCLFFCQEAGECYDVCVDLFVLDGDAVLCHVDDFVQMLDQQRSLGTRMVESISIDVWAFVQARPRVYAELRLKLRMAMRK
jgi:hypothetical protein